MDKILEDNVKKESLYHHFLIFSGLINPTSISSNEELKFLLKKEGSFEEIYNQSTNGTIQQIMDDNPALRHNAKYIERANFDIIKITDDDFPNELKKYKGTPAALYFQGDKNLFDLNSIAAVGTRRIDENDSEDCKSIKKAKEFLEDKIKNNYIIVSGLALGCDTIAHKTALENNGKTIAVLGNPIDRYYPRENKDLQNEIAKNHLVVSQYPIASKVWPNFFSYRNITTTALAKEGILVIKTKEKSGTNYAIKNCAKQGKKLYVIDSKSNRDAFNSGKILKKYYEINWV